MEKFNLRSFLPPVKFPSDCNVIRQMNVRKLTLITIFCFSLVLAACKDATPIDGPSFKKLWDGADNNSAVSWWYVGESQSRYVLAEKWPTTTNTYSVSKRVIEINGIPPFKNESGNNPVNLKKENVLFK